MRDTGLLLILLGAQIFWAVFLSHQIFNIRRKIMADVASILAEVANLSTDVDTLIAQSTPPDLQPVADAIAAVDAKVRAKIAPPST